MRVRRRANRRRDGCPIDGRERTAGRVVSLVDEMGRPGSDVRRTRHEAFELTGGHPFQRGGPRSIRLDHWWRSRHVRAKWSMKSKVLVQLANNATTHRVTSPPRPRSSGAATAPGWICQVFADHRQRRTNTTRPGTAPHTKSLLASSRRNRPAAAPRPNQSMMHGQSSRRCLPAVRSRHDLHVTSPVHDKSCAGSSRAPTRR